MAMIVDHDLTINHFVWGTTRFDDRYYGNGVQAVVFGGDGNDWMNQGIPHPMEPRQGTPTVNVGDPFGLYTYLYGGVDNPWHNGRAPDKFTAGKPGAIGGQHSDGNDEIHIGQFGWAAPGSGNNLVVIHGGTQKGVGIPIAEMDMGTDHLMMDHSDNSRGGKVGPVIDWDDGFLFEDIKYTRNWTENGHKFVEVATFTAHSFSADPVIIDEQYVHVDVTTDKRGPDHPLIVEWHGTAAWDDVANELHRRADPHDDHFFFL